MIRKFYSDAAVQTLADLRQVKVICSAGTVDRDGEIIVQSGIQTRDYMSSGAGPVLWNHNPNIVIAKCVQIGLEGGNLCGLVQFPPAGTDPEADRYYGKIAFGSVSGVSIGFVPLASEPLDKGNPKKGPQRYASVELLEFSFTPVQSNPSAVVTAKALAFDDEGKRAREKRLREVEVLRLAGIPADLVQQRQSEFDEIREKRRAIAASMRMSGRFVA